MNEERVEQTVKNTTKKPRKPWTEKEDLLVANAVARTDGTNLHSVFDKMAKKLKRTPGAVSTRYYDYIKKQSVLFANVSAYGTAKPNCKNGKLPVKRRRQPEHKTFWKKLVELFKDEFAPKKKKKMSKKK